ncbi:PrsW family intramembrane metalloprotease [Candidatus Kaiserbacteria bacterium]|nr:PrsW family intramembrane metalloprotease [Candidatus Kaiserbacteria bacterium]
MDELVPVGAAILGGVLPALAWLWFWRREDSRHPEPRRLIALAFFAGMLTVAVVIPIEQFVAPFLDTAQGAWFVTLPASTLVFIAWSAIEEVCKYLAAQWTVLRRREDDEPIDPVIYMVTVALGFAAAENTLFLLSPLAGTSLLQTVLTGDLRFVGATLLHVLASSVIGVAYGLAFYKRKSTRRRYVFFGVILAIALHGAFNFLILNTPETNLLRTFGLVWIGLVALLGVLEFIKRIRPRWS